MSNSPSSISQRLSAFLPKISHLLIGFSALCYVTSGFAITNLYLSSLGIVSFDLLKPRYIIAGLLFIFFITAIIYLLYSLIRTLRLNSNKTRIVLLFKAFWSSTQSIVLLFLVTIAVGIFSGNMIPQDYIIPQEKQTEIPWSTWFSAAPLSVLHTTCRLLLLAILSAFLIFLIVILINPKDKEGKKTPRKQIFIDIHKKIKELKIKDLGSFAIYFVLFYLFNLSTSLLSFFLSGKLALTTFPSLKLTNGWSQFINAIIIIYSFIAIWLTIIFLYPPGPSESDETIHPKFSSWIYLAAICIIIIVQYTLIKYIQHYHNKLAGGNSSKFKFTFLTTQQNH